MCEYCGCRSITVIARFTAEHEDIANACGDLHRAGLTGDREAVRARVDHLAGLLHPHTSADEVGLFTVLRQEEEFVEHVDALCAEHVSLDAEIEAVRAGDHSRIEGLVFALREHMAKEENGLFPATLTGLDGEQWDEVDALTPPAGAEETRSDRPVSAR